MNKKFVFRLFVFILCLSFLMNMAVSIPVQAQAPVSTPTPLPTPTQVPVIVYTDPNIVTFSQLKQSEFELIGPFDSNGFSFAIPADWSLKTGAALTLSLAVSFNSLIQTQLNSQVVYGGGTLTVSLNNKTLDVLQLNQVGETEANISIPPEDFVSTDPSGRMQLNIVLNADFSCLANENMSVIVHANSHFTLPHDSVQPDTSLLNFPRPLYQNSFNPDSALLVIPDQPTAAELQSALSVAAGLGNITIGGLTMDMTTVSKLTAQQATSTNLIFVGKAGSLPTLVQLQKLPVPDNGGQFSFAGAGPDDGLIQMINSPWNAARVVLVVSGNTDKATIKAAQALSSGVMRPNTYSNLSIVQQVQTIPVSTTRATDQSLADLGSTGNVFQRRGVNNVSFNFFVPLGYTVTPEAYFELDYGHSALLNYDRSGIVVLLNNRPIGSVRMSDVTAAQSTNQVKFQLPTSELRPGTNSLEISATIVPNDDCTPPDTQGLWVNIWPQSLLHLPLTPTAVSSVSNYDLTEFPALFAYNPVLSDTAFVLPHNDLDSWREAVQLASYIGNKSKGSLAALSAFYADGVPVADRSNYNLLIVGHPSQLPIMGEISNNLPAPFSGTNDVAKESNLQVTYLISPTSPLGYVEMASSPWNASRIVMAVVGNGVEGVQWATTSLLDPSLNWQVTGNFAVINNRQIIATDTRVTSSGLGGIVAQVPTATVVSPILGSSLPYTQSQSWIIPVLVVTVILIALILLILAIQSWSHNRSRRKNWLTTLLEKLHIRRKDD